MFELFSKPDPCLSSETSVDPMGLQVIWTHYAQAVFKDKVSTLITDARILTINLFHAYVLNELHENNVLSNATDRFREWKTDRDVRLGLLIALEDFFIYTFYENRNNGKVDTDGLQGMTKANQIYRANNKKIIRAEQNAGLLTRQIQLGMMGRNKGGMVGMGVFNGDLLLNPEVRSSVHELFNDWPNAIKLKEHLFDFIRKEVLTASSKQYPTLDYDELKSKPSYRKVRDGYLEVFGKRKLPKAVREFWLDRIGLHSGAPKAIYDATGKYYAERQLADPSLVMKETHAVLSKEPGEQEKIENILRIEPFLSLSDYVFRFIARKDFKRIADHEEELNLLRKQLEADVHMNQLPPKAPHLRLQKLITIMIGQGRSLHDWIADIINYHKKVMDERKNSSWLELQPRGTIKHVQAAFLPEEINTAKGFLKKRPWFHRYYVDSIQSLRELLK